jgi:hypothetical protein
MSEKKMRIEADIKKIRSQAPYRASSRKRQLIREAIEKLRSLHVIQSSSSKIASSVVVI